MSFNCESRTTDEGGSVSEDYSKLASEWLEAVEMASRATAALQKAQAAWHDQHGKLSVIEGKLGQSLSNGIPRLFSVYHDYSRKIVLVSPDNGYKRVQLVEIEEYA